MATAKLRDYLLGAALLFAVLLPLVRSGDDDFPISTYPMFSGTRERETTITHAIGVDADGSRAVLPPRVVANDEVVQAFETLRKAARDGSAASAELCLHVANRVDYSRVVSVEIVSDRYDAVAYFQGDKAPRSSALHARCGVPR